MNDSTYPVQGAGLGLRRSLLSELASCTRSQIGFMEVAPENWIGVGGRLGKQFREYTERFPFVIHGLSLSIGSTDPLDVDFVKQVKQFMETHGISCYTEHLSYCSHQGHMYDLMPIPFSEDAIRHVVERIKTVQDILGQRIALENVSYYASPGKEMSELDFINAVIKEADCNFLLDVNNIYVNSVNHKYDPYHFLTSLPNDRVSYVHVAGHYVEDKDLLVDTHGASVIDPVWSLLDAAYQQFGVMPTLLERDFNIPSVAELLSEVNHIKTIQERWQISEQSNKAS